MPRLGKRPKKSELPSYELAAPVRKEFTAMHKLIDDAESFLDEDQPELCFNILKKILMEHVYVVGKKYEPKEKKDETSS